MVLLDDAKVDMPAMTERRFEEGCFSRVAKSLVQGGVFGVLMGYARLAWYPDPYRYSYKGTEHFYATDFRYVLRNLPGPVVFASLTCATFTGVECIVENMRDEAKESTWVNAMAGGAAAGLLMGSMSKRFDIMSTTALGTGLLMAMVEYNVHFKAAEQGLVSDNRGPSVAELKERYPKFKHL